MDNLTGFVSVAILLHAGAGFAQARPKLKVGDLAPTFRVGKWYKGSPFAGLQKGKVYVVDFWATRCPPCVEAIPHISALAKRFHGKVNFTGVSVQKWPDGTQNDTRKLVEAFLNTSTGKAMKYNVAVDTIDGFMVKRWFDAAGFDAIPCAFVVGKTGRIAWMGDPNNLDSILASLTRQP